MTHRGENASVLDPGRDRDQSAEDRDRRAEAHDDAARERDQRADARDERADAREALAGRVDSAAVADRAAAARDRRGGSSDRTQAADDRRAAAIDRSLAARDRADLSLDELTHVHIRGAGRVELEREIARARRTDHPFALAFVDVDHLKLTNDSLGHSSGDQRLRTTADSIRAHVRTYDLIIRFGGDEFLCALPDMTVPQAAERFARVSADLAVAQQGSITVGLAQLQPDDALVDLITRADEAMYTERLKPVE